VTAAHGKTPRKEPRIGASEKPNNDLSMTMGAVQGGNVISHSCVGTVTVPRFPLCANPAQRRTRAIAKNRRLGNFLSFTRKIRAQRKSKR
jgi:hypothetical protein